MARRRCFSWPLFRTTTSRFFLISSPQVGSRLTQTISPIFKVYPFKAFKTVFIDAAADLFHGDRSLDGSYFFRSSRTLAWIASRM